MALKTSDVLQRLHDFDFSKLFIEELGWSNPVNRRPETVQVNGDSYERLEIADLSRVKVLQITSSDGDIPDEKTRSAIWREISKHYHENLLIFVDDKRSRTFWHWAKREDGRVLPREHSYFKGQPGDLFLSKISGLFVDIGEFDENGEISVVEVFRRLRDALDVEKVTKTFYEEYRDERLRFAERIGGIDDERDQIWYTSALLNRLMFVYFLQQKFFLDGGNRTYLQDKLAESRTNGGDLFYQEFLSALFFDGLARPNEERDREVRQVIGDVPYLGGSIFMRHEVEQRWDKIAIPDAAFDGVLDLFTRWSWNLNDTPGGDDKTINPDVLGYIFEKYINQKAFGAYYTPREITQYLCEQTVDRIILDRVNEVEIPGMAAPRRFNSVDALLSNLDSSLCHLLLNDVLPRLSLLDPACGSGAFLIAALNKLVHVYRGVIGQIEFVGNHSLQQWLAGVRNEHGSLDYYIKKKVISDNLYGVDIMPEAVEMAELRLYLALVSSVYSSDQLEPLPNIDFNLLTGNSLIGLLRVDEDAYDKKYSQMGLFSRSYTQLVQEKNRLIAAYRDATTYSDELEEMRDEIQRHRAEAHERLNQMLLDQFNHELNIRYEQATWDLDRNKAGRSKKRRLRIKDIEALVPFHWGYEFDSIMNDRGGFDAIIANPPWEVWQTDEKEFFHQYLPTIKKNKLRIEDWKAQRNELMRDPQIRAAWLEYVSRFPHTSKYFKNAPQYQHQNPIIDGRNRGGKNNLYGLFLEQCFNLLRASGECGIVIQEGIYNREGTTDLRKLLLDKTHVTGMIGFENRRGIFEGVHRSFKFVVLTFEKGGRTDCFPVAFMRQWLEDINEFPDRGGVNLSATLIRNFSPTTLSIMEFKSQYEIDLATKMLKFPLLGKELNNHWNFVLTQEFNISSDSDLFEQSPSPDRLPLFIGDLFHQFQLEDARPPYWISEKRGRRKLLGRRSDDGQLMDYQRYRWVHRRISRNTDSRTFITTIAPKDVFTEVNSTTLDLDESNASNAEMLALCTITNSFTLDWFLRLKVSETLNQFYLYQLPVPRLTNGDPEFQPIVERAARLICSSPEYDDLAKEVGLQGHEDGVTEKGERARLRAELDGMIAHLYGLTEDEFTYILTTFPLVDQQTKDASLEEYRRLVPSPDDAQLAALIQAGESARLEFKSAFAWNRHRSRKDGNLKEPIIQAAAGFLNSPEGGAIIIGVEDDGTISGLADDYTATNPQRPGHDTYEQALRSALGDYLGGDVLSMINVTFHQVDSRDVCRVAVAPSPRPVYLAGDFYVRIGNGKRRLNAQESANYQRDRWPSA